MQKNILENWQDIEQVYIPPLKTSGWTENVLNRDIWEKNKREENIKIPKKQQSAEPEIVEAGASEYTQDIERWKEPSEEVVLQPEMILESRLEQEEEHTVLLVSEPAQQEEEDCTVLLTSQELEEKAYLVRTNTNERIDINGEKNAFTIGKSAKADYQIQGNDAISRKHIQITKNEGGYWLEDLHSLNHTYIENREIQEPVKLEDGQIFKIADEELSFHIEKLKQ